MLPGYTEQENTGTLKTETNSHKSFTSTKTRFFVFVFFSKVKGTGDTRHNRSDKVETVTGCLKSSPDSTSRTQA